eukprot:144569_1
MAEEKQNKKGFIEWEVDRNLLLQFKNAKHKQVFCSPQFIIDGTIWRIRFQPHGDKSPDDCSISLQCVIPLFIMVVLYFVIWLVLMLHVIYV